MKQKGKPGAGAKARRDFPGDVVGAPPQVAPAPAPAPIANPPDVIVVPIDPVGGGGVKQKGKPGAGG